MAVNMQQPSDTEIGEWFVNVSPLAEGEFEFALVLGGTVSAGAYTAGAVDFLIQAMDCLAEAQTKGEIPKHTVRLKLIAGTSGGGVNAAIAARALAYRYPHLTPATHVQDGTDTGNPFYDTWIRKLHLSGFLETDDVGPHLASLLNGKPIDTGGDAIVNFAGGPAGQREWVAAPLRLILTLTSLRGVPYRTNFGTSLGQGYVDHADYGRFALVYPGQQIDKVRPDEFVLGFGQPDVPQSTDWPKFAEYAKATAAFPLGFPPRALERPTEHYRWRVVPYPPGPGGGTSWRLMWPDWQAMGGTNTPEVWKFLAVDGGATDNEPIQLARSALSGLLTHSPRDPDTANRAVWLIDPFAGRAPLGPAAAVSFPSEFGSIATTLTQQTRYSTADLLMAADDEQFSRFMLTPTRDGKVGEDVIASGGLGAFVGFACPAFMHYDYMLGRQNCWKFLKEEFRLAPGNQVFAHWTKAQLAAFTAQTPKGPRMPIIPLVGAVKDDPGFADWPNGKLDPEIYRDPIEKRFRRIVESELSGSWFRRLLSIIGAHAAQAPVTDAIINAMQDYLKKSELTK